MYKNIALLLAAACLIQATPIDDLVNELRPKLEEAASKVADVVNFGGEIIGLTYREIETRISELDNNINGHEHQIEESVKQAETNATASKRNISACVEQVEAGRKTIKEDRKSLQLCRISPELNNASMRLIALQKQEVVIGTAPLKCSTQNHNDLDKIRKCVEIIVKDAENQADDTEKYIDTSVKEAKQRNSKCTNAAVGPINEHLRKIETDFENCVKHSKFLRDLKLH